MILDVPVIPTSTRVHFGMHEKGHDCAEFLIRDLAANPRSLKFDALLYKVNAVITCVGRNRSKPVLGIQFAPSPVNVDYEITKPDGSKEVVPNRSQAEIFKHTTDLLGDLWFRGHYNDTEELWLFFAVKPK